MLTRKQLPQFGYLNNIHIDIDELVQYCKANRLLNESLYDDIKVSSNSTYKDFVIANEFCKESFFKESGAPHMEGEKYKQLYLTEFDKRKKSDKVNLHNTTIFERTKRLNPNHPDYLPEADERNYGIPNSFVKGKIKNILKLFQSPLGRVRFAYLAPGFKIKPHVDYDPSYIVRYHIPLFTNVQCILGSIRNNSIRTINLPADGRVYFINTGCKHWAENNSTESRIHLIVDVQDQLELKHLVEI